MASAAIAEKPTAAAIRANAKSLFIRSLPEWLCFSPQPDLIGVCPIGKARPSTSGERRIERMGA
jgi:hypothetical protein